MSKYINPFTDFGFKYIFGQEPAKPFLIDFLNELLKSEAGFEPIEDVTFLNKEKTKKKSDERGIIYDILCRSEDGREFIVEMQNVNQSYFIDRGIYYVARSLSEQGESGRDWNFAIRPVYNISFLNFTLREQKGKVRIDAALCDVRTGKPISDKIRFIFIQFPEFKTEESGCGTIFEQWIYILKHMNRLTTFPFTTDRKIYRELEDRAKYANLTVEERREYDSQLKAYRDYNNQLQYKYDEGRAEGLEKGIGIGVEKGIGIGVEKGIGIGVEKGIGIGVENTKKEAARLMKEQGMNDELILTVLKLTPEQLASFLSSSN